MAKKFDVIDNTNFQENCDKAVQDLLSGERRTFARIFDRLDTLKLGNIRTLL
jgi:hypothetical protein